MAFDVLDEHEQGELVRKWVRENWLSIVIGIGLGLVLLFGVQQWRTHRANRNMEAATLYDVLSADVTKKDFDAAKAIAAKLKTDHAETPYAVFAAMREADISAQKGDLENAYASLDWAWQHAGIDALKAPVGIDLARVQLARGKAQDALDLLGKLPQHGFEATGAELRGDALSALGRKDEARAAYGDALAKLDPAAPDRALVEMKISDLGVAAKVDMPAKADKADTEKKSS
ncbi:MAG: tetratricopeptide repeat protein [Proteobacteria bacterium]|nr:tetratricopeptide repeat protein [Pseudomonadota bacterium]